MKRSQFALLLFAATAFQAAPSFAQATAPSASPGGAAATSAPPNDAEMAQMMELAKLNENHKLLASLAGTWTYNVKMWMAPGMPPMESGGTGVRRPIMDGRYFVVDHTGQMMMPGADGKMKPFEFKGFSIEGYDNVKKKFVATWSDNMGTGVMMSEGTYDAAAKMFTYTSTYEMTPGKNISVRETLKIVDADHHTFEWFENRGGSEAKTMEISYTRKK